MITPPLGQSANELYSVERDIEEYFGPSSIFEESSSSIGNSSDSIQPVKEAESSTNTNK